MLNPSEVLVAVILSSRNTSESAPCEFYAMRLPDMQGWSDIYIPRAAAWELARLGFGLIALGYE